MEQGLGVPVSRGKERAGRFGGCRACTLHQFSALLSLSCEVNLSKMNSKVLRSSELVSAGKGRNSTWSLGAGSTGHPEDLAQRVPEAGHCCRALSSPCCAQHFTGRELGGSPCSPCPCLHAGLCLPGRAGPGTVPLAGDQQQAAAGGRQAARPDAASRAARRALLQPAAAPHHCQGPPQQHGGTAWHRSGMGTGTRSGQGRGWQPAYLHGS